MPLNSPGVHRCAQLDRAETIANDMAEALATWNVTPPARVIYLRRLPLLSLATMKHEWWLLQLFEGNGPTNTLVSHCPYCGERLPRD